MAKGSETHCVLVSRFSALGDVAMTLPAVYDACAANPDVRFVNREEDDGNEGLRRSKQSYHPVRLLQKYYAEIV